MVVGILAFPQGRGKNSHKRISFDECHAPRSIAIGVCKAIAYPVKAKNAGQKDCDDMSIKTDNELKALADRVRALELAVEQLTTTKGKPNAENDRKRAAKPRQY